MYAVPWLNRKDEDEQDRRQVSSAEAGQVGQRTQVTAMWTPSRT